MPSNLDESLLIVQVSTPKRSWDLRAFERDSIREDDLRAFLKEYRRQGCFRWSTRSSTILVPELPYATTHTEQSESESLRPESLEEQTTVEQHAADPSAADVCKKLNDPATTKEGRRRLVLIAETLPLKPQEKRRFCDALRAYIETYRDSENPDDLVAVGAAIRKLVLNLPTDDLASVASLLEAGHRAPVSLEVELEIAKAIVWHLKANPPACENQFPELANRLFEIAATYANDRLLPREKYAATALNAVLALLLLRSHSDETLASLKNVQLRWFTELVASRCRRLQKHLSRNTTNDEMAELATVLGRFSAELSSQS